MTIWSDIRHAARRLAHEPGFAVISVLMLALGIGANTAIFTIVDGVLLRPLPYREPGRLLSLREIIPAFTATYPTLPVSARHFVEWRSRCSSFESMSLISRATTNLTGEGEPERLNALRVSANLLETMGVQTRLGRGFLPGEDTEGKDGVVILGNNLWSRRFGADPSVIGRTILLDSQPHVVVGVMPSWFRVPAAPLLDTGRSGTREPELFKPITFPKYELDELMGMFNHGVVARLKSGISREAALSELNVVESQIEKLAGENVNLRASAVQLQESVVGESRPGLIILLGAVGAVLLIVCVNLANLMLARAQRRGHEWAVRAAVGATQGRIIRLVLAESLLVALLGGILGVGVATAGLGELVRLAPPDIPRLNEVRIDWRVLLFAFSLVSATGILFGFAPAWHSARVDPQSTLKSGGMRATGARRESRLRNVLVSAEVGMSTVLLVLAALLGSSLMRVLRAEKGFNAPTVLTADIAIPWTKYQKEEQRNRFHEQLLDRVKSQPGIASAAICTAIPLTGETWVDAVWVPGDTRPQSQRPLVNVRFISADYLATMGIPLLSGRTFEERDRTKKVAIISERLARELWPGLDPVGRKFTRGDNSITEVIGLSRDVRSDADKAAAAIMYRPYWDWAPRQVLLVARAVADPRSIAGAMRDAVRGVDPDVPVPEMHTMQQILEQSVAQRRFQTILASVFAATALLLAGLGIYGVVSYAVARRTPEIGVRIALGAGPMAVRRMVVVQAMLPVAIGLAAGSAAALGTGKVLETLLYEVRARDPWTIVGVAVLLASVAACACWGPMRRATRVDPLQALRYE